MLFSIAHIDCDAPRATPLSSADILPHARLQLPPLHPLWHVTFFQLETTPLLARAPPGEPFAPTPADHVLVFTLQYATADHARLSPRYQGFVHARALLAHVPEGPPPAVGDAPTVAWDAWGPAHTRFASGLPWRARYARYVHGQRVVLSRHVRIDPACGLQSVVLLDFNVHARRVRAAREAHAAAVAAAAASAEDLGVGGRPRLGQALLGGGPVVRKGAFEVVRGETVLKAQQGPFAADVRSALPYVQSEVAVDWLGRPSEFMIDGERLLQMSVRPDPLSLPFVALELTAL